MTKYLISFPSEAMVLSDDEFVQAGIDSRAVVRAAKDVGVWVFGGGIDGSAPPVRVSADGTVTDGTYEPTRRIEGGYAILELPNRDAAVEWAAKIAKACRCDQELREFGYDPES
jgi:hypothetical protein